jgi:membrane associated rhomboid family serine protease
MNNKRTYLFAISTWYAAFGMQSVVFAWLVTMLLREPAERVGLAQMSILLPGMLLILLAGAIADRVGIAPPSPVVSVVRRVDASVIDLFSIF